MTTDLKTIGNLILSNELHTLKQHLKENNLQIKDIHFTLIFSKNVNTYFRPITEEDDEYFPSFIIKYLDKEIIICLECKSTEHVDMTWPPLFLALFYGCSEEMTEFIIENTVDIHYVDKLGVNAFKILKLLKYNFPSNIPNSRTYRKRVEIFNGLGKWKLIKEFNHKLFHFHDKYFGKNGISDSNFNIIQKNINLPPTEIFLRDETSFYCCSGDNLYKYDMISQETKKSPYQHTIFHKGHFIDCSKENLIEIYNENHQLFTSIDIEDYKGIFPYQDYIFFTIISKDEFTLKRYKNYKFQDEITVDYKYGFCLNNFFVVKECYLFVLISETKMNVYYFTSDTLKFVNVIEGEQGVRFSHLSKIRDDLIVSSYFDELRFWEVRIEGKEKVYLIQKDGFKVPTTLWNSISSIRYNNMNQTLIVTDSHQYSIIYEFNEKIPKFSFQEIDLFFHFHYLMNQVNQ